MRVSRAHVWIFAVVLAVFALPSFLLVVSIPPTELGPLRTTAAIVCGPFAGAIARDCQTCCAENSRILALYAGPALAVGVLAQLVPTPAGRRSRWLRLIAWGLGWTAWFGAAIVSFLHALE